MRTLFILFISISVSLAQAPEGTFEGVDVAGTHIVATVKCKSGVMIGNFYESRVTKHSFLGTCENNTLRGTMALQTVGNMDCDGEIKGDSLILRLYKEIDTEPRRVFRLKKISGKLNTNVDLLFGKEQNDDLLIGQWEFINLFKVKAKEYISDRVYKTIYFDRDKTMVHSGGKYNKLSKYKQQPFVTWFTTNNDLFMRISYSGNETDVWMGKYKIISDTLTISTNEEVGTHIRKK